MSATLPGLGLFRRGLVALAERFMAVVGARAVSTSEIHCRPSPKRHTLLPQLSARQHATPKCLLLGLYPALLCVI